MTPALADIAGQVERWQGIFGGGPLAAFIGVLLAASGILFVLLIRAKNAHLADAGESRAALREMNDIMRQNTSALQSTTRIMELSIARFDAVREQGTGEWPAYPSVEPKKERP